MKFRILLAVFLAVRSLTGANISLLLNSGTHQLASPLDAWTVNGANIYNAMGLGGMSLQLPGSVNITGGSISGITDLAVADGGTGASDAATARANLGIVNFGNLTGPITSVGLATTINPSVVTESMQSLTDLATFDVSIARHGYAPKAPNDATKFLNGVGTWTVPSGGGGGGSGTVTSVSVVTVGPLSGTVANATTTPAISMTLAPITESLMSLSDVTTLNVTTLRHGFVPKLINDPTKYLDSQGNFTVPPGQSTGSVVSVSVVTANGVSGTVSDANNSPNITLTLGAITPTSVNGVVISGSATPTLAVTGTTTVSGANTGDQTSVTGNAGTATALATARAINGVNFDGTAAITVTAAADTLSGATLASGVTASSLTSFGTSPSLTTPVLGVATATSINKVAITAPATSATLTIANGKTLTVNNTLAFSGTDSSTLNIGTGGTLGTAAYTASSAYQVSDADLTALAGLTSAADALPYFTGSGTAGTTTLTAAGRALIDDSSASAMRTTLALADANKGVITFVIDGGGSVITTGQKKYVRMPTAGTITGITFVSDVSTSTVLDVWKGPYSSYPPVIGGTITASAKPTLSSAVKAQDTTLTGWTLSFSAGDFFGFNVDSNSTATWLMFQADYTKN